MAAPAYGNVTVLAAANRTNSTFTKPTGLAVGNAMVLLLGGGTVSFTPPSGFTPMNGADVNGVLASGGPDTFGDPWTLCGWEKVATSADVSASSFTVTHANVGTQGVLLYATGNDTTTPIGEPAVALYGVSSPTTFPSLVTGAPNELVCVFQADDFDSTNAYTTPASTPTLTSRVNAAPNFLATGVLATAGATTTATMANNSATGAGWVSVTFGIQPPVVSAPPPGGFFF